MDFRRRTGIRRVHWWRTQIFLYGWSRLYRGKGDLDVLKRSFGRLIANFTWCGGTGKIAPNSARMCSKADSWASNNIAFSIARAARIPTGGYLAQAGTAPRWAATVQPNLLEIAVEIASQDPNYRGYAPRLFVIISCDRKMRQSRGTGGMWAHEDGFSYEWLRLPEGQRTAS